MINKARLIALTQKVIQFDSQNPPGKEAALARFIKKDLESLGLKVQSYSFQKNRPNIVGTLRGNLPRRRAAREAVLITPHIDTVPLGRGWRFDPLGGKIHQGKIYGRGASDDKGNLACSLEVIRSLVEDKVFLRKDIILAATVDEETGSHFGILPLLARGILRPQAALILDSDAFDLIIAQKGLIHCRVQIFGKKAHAAYHWLGTNAIEQAAEIIQRLKQRQFPYKRHPLLRGPTKNIGTIQGGDKVNMVADFCEFALDLRYLPGMDSQKVLREVKGIIRQATSKFRIVIDDLQHPYEIDRHHPFVETYLHTARKMGYSASLKGSEGATVMTFFKKYGIPAFAAGCASRGTAHTTDEYVSIENLYRGAKLLEVFLKEYDQK